MQTRNETFDGAISDSNAMCAIERCTGTCADFVSCSERRHCQKLRRSGRRPSEGSAPAEVEEPATEPMRATKFEDTSARSPYCGRGGNMVRRNDTTSTVQGRDLRVRTQAHRLDDRSGGTSAFATMEHCRGPYCRQTRAIPGELDERPQASHKRACNGPTAAPGSASRQSSWMTTFCARLAGQDAIGKPHCAPHSTQRQ
jgi:hypothetical protein